MQAFFTASNTNFTDAVSGIVSFNIAKTDASINVTPYSGAYDAAAHGVIILLSVGTGKPVLDIKFGGTERSPDRTTAMQATSLPPIQKESMAWPFSPTPNRSLGGDT